MLALSEERSGPLQAWIGRLALLVGVVICFAVGTQAQTLDFSLSGFSSDYTQVAANGTVSTGPGDYGLTLNPSNGSTTGFTNGYVSYVAPDGTSNMMLVDGNYASPTNYNVWSESLTGLSASTTYTFMVDVADPDPAGANSNPAVLGLFVGGSQVGSNFDVPTTTGTWYEWTQSVTTDASGDITLSIQDLNPLTMLPPGDDFTLAAVPAAVTPEPTSMLLFGTGLLGIAFFTRKRLIA